MWAAVYFWKFEQEMTTGDKGTLLILFIPLSHSTKYDCVLRVAKTAIAHFCYVALDFSHEIKIILSVQQI